MPTPEQVQAADAVLQEYNDRIDEAYGLHLDAAAAMPRWADYFLESQRLSLRQLAHTPNGPKTIEDLDAIGFHYGEGDANTSAAVVLHQCTQGELKVRNQKGGANERASSRALFTTIYQFWEDHYRQEFARSLGLAKNGITSDFFGDIRLIRNGIIHHRNKATDDVKKCKLLKLFSPDQEIYLSDDQTKFVIRKLREALNETLRANDNETLSPREFSLEGAEG